MAAWLSSGGPQQQKLTGPFGFTDTYFAEVSFTRTPEGDDKFRPEFLPAGEPDDRLDTATYERAVWDAHVARLAEAR